MLPPFYQKCIAPQLSASQWLTLQMLLCLLQWQKTVQIEKLGALLSLPIKYESRRRHIQRFLSLNKLTIKGLWFPIIKKIIREKVKKGSSNVREQKEILSPVIHLLKEYEIVVLADREFGNVKLANWLICKGIGYIIRVKEDRYFREKDREYKHLSSLGLVPGKSFFYSQVEFTKQKGFGRVNLAGYWSKKKQKKAKKKSRFEGLYLITSLDSWEEAVKVYRKRWGIEAMFKDCKTGGYNLEKCQAKSERLLTLVLLIAMAYTAAVLQGQKMKRKGIQKYICRLKEPKRKTQRHSNFWVGLYGQLWVGGRQMLQEWVEAYMRINSNKLTFFQQGLRAQSLILSTL